MALNLLIIDDDPALRRLYETVLANADERRRDVHLDLAPSLDAGRELIERHHYDLALVDLNLSSTGFNDFSGLRMLDHLKRTAPKTEAFIMSSQDDARTVHKCLRAGARGFLSKNNDFIPALREKVAEAHSSGPTL